MDLVLQSGLVITDPEQKLDSFLVAEWAFYDGFPDDHPDEVTPLDVLAPVAMNAYAFRGGANNLRRIQAGLAAACNPLLPAIPVTADRRDFDPDLSLTTELLHSAVTVDQVLIPVATKVLFRKRRDLIPMLDNVVLAYYFKALDQPTLLGRSQDKAKAADVAREVLVLLREDLKDASPRLVELKDRAEAQNKPVGPLRIMEVLTWCEIEPRGYYRTLAKESEAEGPRGMKWA